MATGKRVLSGIQPSGILHIGNYFGMMKQSIDLQADNDCYYFIADLHALTQSPDPELLRERVLGVAVDFLACGLDPARVTFFRQSRIPEVPRLTWLLCCMTPVGLLERCHSYKDKTAKGLTPNHGLFTYPVLMAADILIYGSHLVPVGQDQKQHVEVTRDIATRFNNQYGNVLTIPDVVIREEVAVVPGVDGQKMSKSYDNTIELFPEEKKVRKKIMRIVTDSTPVGDPKDPDSSTIYALFKLFATAAEADALAERYRGGGMGYGEAKQQLFEKYWEYFRPFRARRAELVGDLGEVEHILEQGEAQARETARATLAAAHRAVGL